MLCFELTHSSVQLYLLELAECVLFPNRKIFSSDTHQSMKTSDNDLKVNLNIYPDAVNVLGCV